MTDEEKSQKQSGEGRDKKGKKKRVVAIIVVIAVIAVLVGIIVYLLVPKKEERTTLVTEQNADTVVEDMQDKVAAGMFECRMSMTWNYTDGGKTSEDAYVANSENNNYTICFDVIENESGDTIYSSPYIPVGSEIAGFALDKELDEGTYEATVKYTLVDQDNDYEEVSDAGFIITLNVND